MMGFGFSWFRVCRECMILRHHVDFVFVGRNWATCVGEQMIFPRQVFASLCAGLFLTYWEGIAMRKQTSGLT